MLTALIGLILIVLVLIWRKLDCQIRGHAASVKAASEGTNKYPGQMAGEIGRIRTTPTPSLLYKTLHTVTESLRLSFRPHTKIRAVWGFSPTVRRWYSLNLRRRMRPRVGALYE